MLKAYAAEFVRLFRILTDLHAVLEKAVVEGTMDKPMSQAQTAQAKRWLGEMMELSDEVSLPMVTAQIARIEHMLADGERDAATLVAANREIRTRLEDELSSHKFIYVSPNQVKFYGARFGLDVEDKFPTAISDIEYAGKCLSLSLGTASVFHLMRTMECAVQKLTATLGFTNTDRAWGNLLADMRAAIEAKPKGAERDRWSECLSLLYHVKQAWRNDTMHPKQTYTEDEAQDVYVAVRSFMNHLATMI